MQHGSMRYRLRLAQAGHIYILGVLGRAECHYTAKGAVLPRDSAVLRSYTEHGAVLPHRQRAVLQRRVPLFRGYACSTAHGTVLPR